MKKIKFRQRIWHFRKIKLKKSQKLRKLKVWDYPGEVIGPARWIFHIFIWENGETLRCIKKRNTKIMILLENHGQLKLAMERDYEYGIEPRQEPLGKCQMAKRWK